MVFVEAVFSIKGNAGLTASKLSGVHPGIGMESRLLLGTNVLEGKQGTIWGCSFWKDITKILTIIDLLVVAMNIKLREPVHWSNKLQRSRRGSPL